MTHNQTGQFYCPPSADNAFGPAVKGCRDNFDFTFAFEQIFFSIVPAALLLLATPWRVWSLSRRRSVVGGVLLKYTKVVS